MADARQPLGVSCRHCGSSETWIEWRHGPAPLGAYARMGVVSNVTATLCPYVGCDGCGHVSRGEVANPDGS